MALNDNPVTVLIVEDDAATRALLRRRVSALPDYQVSGETGSIAGALAACQPRAPRIVLVDLELEDGNGIDLIRALADSATLMLVISVFGDETSVLAAIEAGAHGYLLKDDSETDIGAALTQLVAGGSPISPFIARHLLQRLRPAAPASPSAEPDSALSDREREVLNLASRGYTYGEIADLLDVSLNTVSSYTRRVYRKLAVHSRSAAVFEAQRLGLIDAPHDSSNDS